MSKITLMPKSPPVHQKPTVSSISKVAQFETTPKHGAQSTAPSVVERSNSRRRSKFHPELIKNSISPKNRSLKLNCCFFSLEFDLARASPFKNYHSQLMARYAKQAKNEQLNQSVDQTQAKINRVIVSPTNITNEDDQMSKQNGR